MSDNAQRQQSIIRAYLTTQGFFWAAYACFTVLFSLAVIDMFHLTAADAAIYTGVVQFTVVFLEIPTGAFGDCVGRKQSFRIAMILYIFAFSFVGLCAFDERLWRIGAFAMGCLPGIGWAFYSGSLDAWMTHNLRLADYDGEMHRVFSMQMMLRDGATLLVGPLMLALHFVAPPIPWFASALLFVLGWFAFRLLTRSLDDHDVGGAQTMTMQLLRSRAHEVVQQTYAALRESPVLRGWISICACFDIVSCFFFSYLPVWLSQFDKLHIAGYVLNTAELVWGGMVLSVIARLLGGYVAKRYSWAQDRRRVRFLGLVLCTLLPSALFFTAYATSFTLTSFIVLTLALMLINGTKTTVYIIAQGCFSDEITNDAARNTLFSAHSFLQATAAGVVMISWGAWIGGSDPVLPFQMMPLIVLPFLVYGLCIVLPVRN